MAGVPIYETAMLPEWLDYNGHVRDACYCLIASSACDALMDRIGIDAAYRERTRCTLYTLEMHVHYLHELQGSDRVAADVTILGSDHKRLHAGFTLRRAPDGPVAATVEFMLLHVRQGGSVATPAFPPEVGSAIAALAAAVPPAGFGPGSRALSLAGGARR